MIFNGANIFGEREKREESNRNIQESVKQFSASFGVLRKELKRKFLFMLLFMRNFSMTRNFLAEF